jgi:hypothetical protein
VTGRPELGGYRRVGTAGQQGIGPHTVGAVGGCLDPARHRCLDVDAEKGVAPQAEGGAGQDAAFLRHHGEDQRVVHHPAARCGRLWRCRAQSG